jgi:hypothetical protein
LGSGNGIELVQRLITGIGDPQTNSFAANVVIFYPNPVRSVATIKIIGTKWDKMDKIVTVFNSVMKEVIHLTWMKNQPVLAFRKGDLACGIYCLVVETTDKKVVGSCKIVVLD